MEGGSPQTPTLGGQTNNHHGYEKTTYKSLGWSSKTYRTYLPGEPGELFPAIQPSESAGLSRVRIFVRPRPRQSLLLQGPEEKIPPPQKKKPKWTE